MSYTPQAFGVIHAECASKSNSRRLVPNGKGGVRSIKSKKALDFVKLFIEAASADKPILGPVQVSVRFYYSSRRPDLDAALFMDALQKANIIANDRQVFDLHATKYLDANDPRVEWSVRQIPEPT